jgi:hypothetical protein
VCVCVCVCVVALLILWVTWYSVTTQFTWQQCICWSYMIFCFNPCRRLGPLSVVCCRQRTVRPFDLVSVGTGLFLPVDWILRNAYWRSGAWNERLSDDMQSQVSVYCLLLCSLLRVTSCKEVGCQHDARHFYHEWEWNGLIVLFVHHHWTDF